MTYQEIIAEIPRLSMQERWRETQKLWQFYLSVGGSLDPEPDSQSPFYFTDDWNSSPLRGHPDMNAVWRALIRKRIREAGSA